MRSVKEAAQTRIFGAPSQTRTARIEAASSNKDPLALPSFEEKSAAIEGKLKRLQADSRYTKLNPEQRVAVRAAIYKKYVIPTFQGAGLSVPDVKTWLKGTKAQGIAAINPEQQARGVASDVVGETVTGAVHAAQEITLFGAKMTKAAFKQMYSLNEYFKQPNGPDFNARIEAAATKRADASIAGKFQKNVQEGLNTTNFWLQTHPRQSTLASAANWTGEQLVQLPLYEALGSVSVIKNLGLTTRLGNSATGRFVINRLNDAFAGFAGNAIGSGGEASTKENLAAGAGFAVFGAVAEGVAGWLGKVKDAREARIKKLPASTPLEGEYLREPEPIKTVSDSAIKKWAANHYAMGGEPFAEDIVHSGFAELTSTATKELGATTHPHNIDPADPVLGHLHEGEKIALQSLALRHYGLSLEELPKEAQHAILTRRLELIREAAVELPAHVPELNQREVEYEFQSWAQTANPDTKSALQWLQQKGVDISKVVSDNQINDIKNQTGIKSVKNATRKASQVKATPEITKGSASLSPKDVGVIHDEAAVYFKNPSKGRLASDGTRVGARDKRTWNERLKADNFKDFVDDLRIADGDKIKFENDSHRLLFHNANRKQLPKEVGDKLLRMLKFKYPGKDAAELGRMSDRLLVHIHQLATTGRLTSERSIFKSSNYAGMPTKWQFELNSDVDKQELAQLAKTIELHPNGLKAMKGLVQIFQANRRMSLSNNPEDWLMYNRVLDNLLTGQVR